MGDLWRKSIDKYKVRGEKIAHIDFKNSYNYIKYNLCNPIAAINYKEELKNKINSLESLPYRGAVYGNEFKRYLIYKNFLIFYEIQEKEKLVIIKRIMNRKVNNKIVY